MTERLGRYEILQRLAGGGMGEVLLARVIGEAGFQKQVVLKRILREHDSDATYVDMFLDEARIAARLNHPNIAHIFDLTRLDDAWVIAMEHVPGHDLRRVIQRARLAGLTIPPGLACRITADIASALHHAFTQTDDTGRALNIVHRDVSPHNVVVGLDGVSKLIDFGIARLHSASAKGRTAKGVVRGKLAYMSPEQARGKALDNRSDLFSLGVVLWEALTGFPLFDGENEIAILQRVMACQLRPPSEVNPDVPAQLDAVCMKALAERPENRFADGRAFAMALEDAAMELRLPCSAARLSEHLSETFGKSAATPIPLPAAVAAAPSSQSVSRSAPTAELRVAPQPSIDASTRSMRTPSEGAPPPATASTSVAAASATAPAIAQELIACRMPLLPDRYVGQARLLEELDAALSSGAQLVTLVGPPGVGKTRAAIELLRRNREALSQTGGAAFVDLDASLQASCVCAALGRSLRTAMLGGDATAEEVAALARELSRLGSPVIVFDQFDRVRSVSMETLTTLASFAPKARLVVTTRMALQLPGERVIEVRPLSGEAAADGVALFLERARAMNPHLKLDEGEQLAVAEIVRRLDGLPVAIELAAKRMKLTTPRALLRRIQATDDALGATGGANGALRKQIEAAMAELGPTEARVLEHLSVFRAAFDLDAAEYVLAEAAGEEPVLDVLQTLHDASLLSVRTESDGQLRFTLLHAVADLARQRVTDRDRLERLVSAHAEYYLGHGAAWAEAVSTSGDEEALTALVRERDNLMHIAVAAFKPGASRAEVERMLRATEALDALHCVRGPRSVQTQLLSIAVGTGAALFSGTPLYERLRASFDRMNASA